MKIFSVSLGRNGTQSLSKHLKDHGFTVTHFYKFDAIKLGDFEENSDGILEHFNSIPDTDAHVDIPTCLIFDKMHEKFPDAKFINITRTPESWVSSMLKMKNMMGHSGDPYAFEEAYCKFYIDTEKTKIQDLTEEELLLIREKHLQRVSDFFDGKANYLEVDLLDAEISEKIKLFLGLNKDISFPNEDGFR
jgi:hypothetical protein